MAAGHRLEFGPTGSSTVRSADLENPTLEVEPNMKGDRMTRGRDYDI